MRHLFGLVVVAILAASAEASAQVVVAARGSFELSFTQLLDGKYLEAEAGFLMAAAKAPEGSQERWLGQELSTLARKLGGSSARRVPPDRVAYTVAFALLLDGKALEAQSAFLTSA